MPDRHTALAICWVRAAEAGETAGSDETDGSGEEDANRPGLDVDRVVVLTELAWPHATRPTTTSDASPFIDG
ncbi:MAG TPA: hypothetical protein VHQ03_12820 [Candidatus Dormibacteraeota bacterium]|nr:hypothetical protein [Candidatus Dormibacteraeota bacterium]